MDLTFLRGKHLNVITLCPIIYVTRRRCGRVCVKFFLSVLGMCEQCSIVYFRGCLTCVKWKARTYIGRELVR